MRSFLFLIILLSIQIITVRATSPDKQLTYIWKFIHVNDSIVNNFSHDLRTTFDSTLQECNDIVSITRLQESQLITHGDISTLSRPDYSLLLENQANYLVLGNISKDKKKNQLSVSIKLYNLVDSGNLAVSSFKYNFDFPINRRGIDLVAMALVSEICPSFNIGINRLTKADELFNQKKLYLDNYKKIVDSLLVTVKPVQDSCTPDTLKSKEIIYPKIDAVDILIPGYGLFTSFKKKTNILHSLLYNVIQVSSITGGSIFVIMSERDRYLNDSNRYKLYGSSLFVTATFTAVVNGIVVAFKLKRQNNFNSIEP